MEKFLVKGFLSDEIRHPLYLTLPKAKEFKFGALNNGNEILRSQELISHAVKRSRKTSKQIHTPPVITENQEHIEVPQTLRDILVKHPYPLSQGPVNLPLDCATGDGKTANEILTFKTIFTHSDSQDCGEWIPGAFGLSAWGETEIDDSVHERGGSYIVSALEQKIQGAASSNQNMNILYTCQFQQCMIHCPCSICTDKRDNCRLQCRARKCKECNSQCNQHELKISRLFNSQTHHFTMKTDKIDQYRFATPHPGIPLDCDSCSKDVLEHQILHLVVHIRCRFCRLEFMPFEKKTIRNIRDFVKADEYLQRQENRTCKFCYIKCKNMDARKKHEANVHVVKEGKHKCSQCDKSYLNKNALEYHKKAKHDIGKSTCDLM